MTAINRFLGRAPPDLAVPPWSPSRLWLAGRHAPTLPPFPKSIPSFSPISLSPGTQAHKQHSMLLTQSQSLTRHDGRHGTWTLIGRRVASFLQEYASRSTYSPETRVLDSFVRI